MASRREGSRNRTATGAVWCACSRTPAAFRGSVALDAGLVTPGVLRGRRFRRLYPDVYVDADAEVDLALRARAAYLLIEDVLVPGGTYRAHPGLVVHRGLVTPEETTVADGIPVTGPVRTALDLACRRPLTEAVVALDALSRRHAFVPAAVLDLGRRRLGARGSAQLRAVVRLADPRAGSPMETRTRLAIVLDGLPVPVLPHPLGPYVLDLATPWSGSRSSTTARSRPSQRRAMRDLDRQAYLSDEGWKVLRFTAAQVMGEPWWVAGRVRAELVRAARRHGVPLDRLY